MRNGFGKFHSLNLSLHPSSAFQSITPGLGGLIVLVAMIGLLIGCGGTQALVLATTTSTADSGLLDEILPAFEQAANVEVRVLAVGTGQAIALAERGDADVLLVHDTEKEMLFVAQGFDEVRRDVMYNDFVIIGPEGDPAGIRGIQSVSEALVRIIEVLSEGGGVFVSRGDNSGTHSKELWLWEEAGVVPDSVWLRSTGQGMGNTLTIANELQAYTLADRGTYLAHRGRLELEIMVEGDPSLFNQYGVIAVSRGRNPRVKTDLALKLVEYLMRKDVQERIGRFGVSQFGQPLFHAGGRQ